MTSLLKPIFHFISIRYKRWSRKSALTKRQQLVIITLLLSGGIIATQLVSPDYRYYSVLGIGIVTYLLSAYGLREDLAGIEWITLLALPVLFTVSICLFYYLLPIRWLTRIPTVILYAIGIYALLLTENIYNVAANRTIALLRAAHTVGFLITLVTFFFFTQTILAFKFYPWINSILIGLMAFALTVQSLWSTTLEKGINQSIRTLSYAISFSVMQISWVLSFWPVNMTICALFITTCFYALDGLAIQYLQEKLYKKTLTEFLTVVIIVFVIVLFTTNWRSSI